MQLLLFSQNNIQTTNTVDTNKIKNALAGNGVTISNIVVNCPSSSMGLFSNATTSNLGLDSGLILTTGVISDLDQNSSYQTSTGNGSAGDPDLGGIAGNSVFDGCKIEFDITPYCDSLKIRYVYGSEEYPEYVNSGYNDAFAFFVSGANPSGGNYVKENIALTPGSNSPVTINTINGGSNSSLYVDNTAPTPSSIVYDGFTVPLEAKLNVVPCSTYKMILTISDAGDGGWDSGVMFEYQGFTCPNPPVITANNDTSICPGKSVLLAATGNPQNIYNWSKIGTPGYISTNPQFSITPTDSPTIYKVDPGAGTCMQPDFVTVTLFPKPEAQISADTLRGCGPLCVSFSYTATTFPFSCKWNFGDGDSTQTCEGNHCYTTSGIFDVKYSYIDTNGCTTTSVKENYIEVYPDAVAGFSTNSNEMNLLESQLHIKDNSQNSSHWEYTINYESTALVDTNANPIVWLDLSKPDSVYITQIVTTDKGCRDTIYDRIYIKSAFVVYAPNALTPNGDLVNDKFTIYVIGAKAYTFRVFDRWGDLIYRDENLTIQDTEFTINWDGHANSGEKLAQQDVYVWTLELRDPGNKIKDYIGHVSIIK
ncbi:MAG: choice-of-anchor L domain-containing protein [Bacteroidetes bacterium]|nr:choice-of-anchor L domain-containing protein [Bacteroidota bacterium]